ncbi:MAG: GspE/PulE family protein [Candidatus Omnitrophica bacterium]|nr:GspE/PulE family protein [Candidatus Omnitrophota bacterium]
MIKRSNLNLSPEEIEKAIDGELLTRFPYSFLETFSILPLKSSPGNVILATDDPSKIDSGEIEQFTGRKVSFMVGNKQVIQNLLKKHYYNPASSQKIIQELSRDEEALGETFTEDLPAQNGDLLDLANQAPIIRLVNQVFYRAILMRASDIHLQSLENTLKIRYRIDGMLHDILALPAKYQPAVISRVKIISDLDIAEKRIPQDGRTSIRVEDKQIDVRVSIIPTFFGESAVLRLLDQSTYNFGLNELGFSPDDLIKFDRLIHYDHGIILLTGPTGSGKTTTLYAALSRINNPHIHIITLEDPVEYQLDGINQIQINPKVGLTFANGLRSILRHDPNVIMVGEIRDRETAEMAIQASLTGHLVFSTLHTNDSTSSITRLLDMGIEPYLIASSVIGIIAQRLVRLNCSKCSQSIVYPDGLLKEIGLEPSGGHYHFKEGKGCEVCLNTGYHRRTGIFEFLEIDDEIRNLIMRQVSAGEIRQHCLRKGLRTLRMDGARKVAEGLTTISEVLRVTQEV